MEPEEEWLKKHHGTVNVRVAVPAGGDRPEWKLDGGVQNIPLDITETVRFAYVFLWFVERFEMAFRAFYTNSKK